MPSFSLPNPQSQPPGQARHFRKTADPSVSEPKGALCIGTLPLSGICKALPAPIGGAGKLAVRVLPPLASQGQTRRSHPERLHLFDPSGKGVVNKDE